jgi:hypothetical protein
MRVDGLGASTFGFSTAEGDWLTIRAPERTRRLDPASNCKKLAAVRSKFDALKFDVLEFGLARLGVRD